MAEAMDPNLLQDFLTESQELIQQLDADLVTLESVAGTPGGQELLNGIFRGLHTIKGAASFLGLTTITHFTHAAEDALNRLRKGELQVTAPVMDVLLKSVDVVRGMIEQLAARETVSAGPEDLVAQLRAIAEARPTEGGAPPTPPTAAPAGAADAPPPAAPAASERPLQLPPDKLALVEFMADDLRQQAQRLDQTLAQVLHPAGRADAAANLGEVAAELAKTAEFFQLSGLGRLAAALAHAAPRLGRLQDGNVPELSARLGAARHLMELQAQALPRQTECVWSLDTFRQRLEAAAGGASLGPDVAGRHDGTALSVLTLDGVLSAAPGPTPPPASPPRPTDESRPGPQAPPAADKPPEAAAPQTAVEQTVRVEVGRLEALLNLVGQLVLSKNHFLALNRKARQHELPIELLEELTGAANALDRLTSELQVGVMRTRMQPLAKLFERYPRVIRDLARMLNKQIHLELLGKETEVDKSVLELLADPLVHLLRNAADHGIEAPAARRAAGKPETGTLRLAAQHQGSHVRVEITDDGRGLDRERIIAKAVEKGLTTAEEAAQLPDQEVFRFIFAPGFSTAERVTDLSGRGVGLDVVRTNIARLNGQVNLHSVRGQGTTLEILIPLTVAIMPAMVVGVGRSLYCIPLQSIVEIVKPRPEEVRTVRGWPVMQLRDVVLPLIDMRQRLGESGTGRPRFAVVVGIGGERAGLLVDGLIGQQEIVIKPLDDRHVAGGPFSGATIRDDGDVSLILDVIQLIRQAPRAERAAA